MSMEIYLIIFVLFVGNFALLEAKTPLVIGKLYKDKFCSWMFSFGNIMSMMSISVQADRQYKNRSGLEYYAHVFAQKDA